MFQKIYDFILDKRLREIEKRIEALENKLNHPAPPTVKTPPLKKHLDS